LVSSSRLTSKKLVILAQILAQNCLSSGGARYGISYRFDLVVGNTGDVAPFVIQEKVLARVFAGLRTVAALSISADRHFHRVTQNCPVLRQKFSKP
jgi:ABC-type enterobactin transport system permease subunit